MTGFDYDVLILGLVFMIGYCALIGAFALYVLGSKKLHQDHMEMHERHAAWMRQWLVHMDCENAQLKTAANRT